MVFNSARIFELPFDPVETLQYEFKNTVTESGERSERRLLTRLAPRWKFSFDTMTFICGEEDDFMTFYKESRGTTDSFLYKSHVDFLATEEPDYYSFEAADRAYTQGIAIDTGIDDAFGSVLEVFKKYAIDDGSGSDRISSYKPVSYLDESTLEVYRSGSLLSPTEWQYNSTDGVLSIQNSAADITWSGEFYTVVRFDSESLEVTKISPEAYTVEGLSLIEVIRNSCTTFSILYTEKDFELATEAELKMPLEPDNSRVMSLPTFNTELLSGREARVPNSSQVYIDETINPSSLLHGEAMFLSIFFIACKGRLSGFQYELDEGLRFVRFNQDTLTLSRKSSYVGNLCKTVYDIGQINLASIDFTVSLPSIDPESIVFLSIASSAADRPLIASISEDVKYYLEQTVFIPPATGAVQPTIVIGNPNRDWLNDYTTRRNNATYAGRPVILIAWHGNVSTYGSSTSPSATWVTRVNALRTALTNNGVTGDKIIINQRVPSGQETNPTYVDYTAFIENAFASLAPFDLGSTAYIGDLVNSVLFNSGVFDVNDISLTPYVANGLGGDYSAEYSPLVTSLNSRELVSISRSATGASAASLDMQTNTRTQLENLLDPSVIVLSLGSGDDTRWLNFFRNLINFNGTTVSDTLLYIGASRVASSYYIDDSSVGQPVANWISDLASLRASINPESRMLLTQMIPAGQELNTDYTGWRPQVSNALTSSPPYDGAASSNMSDIASQFTLRENVDETASAIPLMRLLGAEISFGSQAVVTDVSRPQAYCLRIETITGDVFGFTSFDCDLTIEGVVYKGNNSIDAFAGVSEVNLSVDNGEIKALIDENSPFTVEQVSSGYLRSAKLELRLLNPLFLPATFDIATPIISGSVGQVTQVDGSYTLEVRSVSELLGKSVTYKTSPKCPYLFGDSQCQLGLVANGLQFLGANVLTVANDFGLTMTLDVAITADFARGNVLVTSGVNEGLEFEVRVATAPDAVELVGEVAGDFVPGDTLNITAFCEKDQVACTGYNNFVNFGGMPIGGNFVPGLSRITVTP